MAERAAINDRRSEQDLLDILIINNQSQRKEYPNNNPIPINSPPLPIK